MPTSSRPWSSSRPAGPTKGRPSRSSRSPGCSPTSMTSACRAPSPNTVCVPVFQSGQARQSAAASRSFGNDGRSGTSGAALADSRGTIVVCVAGAPGKRPACTERFLRAEGGSVAGDPRDDRPRSRSEREAVTEVRRPPPPWWRERWWIWGIVLLLFVGALIAFFGFRDRAEETVSGRATVPNVVGLQEDEAVRRIDDRDLEADVERAASERPEGTVIDQN